MEGGGGGGGGGGGLVEKVPLSRFNRIYCTRGKRYEPSKLGLVSGRVRGINRFFIFWKEFSYLYGKWQGKVCEVYMKSCHHHD